MPKESDMSAEDRFCVLVISSLATQQVNHECEQDPNEFVEGHFENILSPQAETVALNESSCFN